MAYQYLLNFLIRGQSEPLQFEVRESHWQRAQELFDQPHSFYHPPRFLFFDTLDGLAVAIGFTEVQLVRFLYNPVEFPSDQKHKEDQVHVWLKDLEKPISIRLDEDKDSLTAFFIALDTGAEYAQFPGLIDEDGELVCFNANELVLVTAPLHEVSEGHKILMNNGELDSHSGNLDSPF